MPLFSSDTPLTRPQKLRRWIAAILICCLGLAFAIWGAIDCSHIQFGYAASYIFAFVFFLGIDAVLIGMVLLVYWRTRSTGAAMIVTGFVMYLSFLGCIQILKKFDRVAWVHEPPLQHFGPDLPASVVIYYRPGTTSAQIEDFDEHKLQNYPSSVHNGKDFPDFVTEYGSLIPEQANGYEGSYMTFKPDAKGPAVDAFVGMIQSDVRVSRIFRNTSPDDIHLPKSEQAFVPNERTTPHSQ